VQIERGDLVVGDADGVVGHRPLVRAGGGPRPAGHANDKEADMMRQLAEGATTLDLLGLR